MSDENKQHQSEPVAWIEVADLKEIAKGARWSGTVWGRPADDKGLYKLPPRVPVYINADPGEVERKLEDQRREFTNAQTVEHRKWAELVDDLKSQLAERDALLREKDDVLMAVKEQFDRHGNSFPDRFDSRVFRWVNDAVASASAEPSKE